MAQVWFVYLLECRNGRLYTGITTDLAARYRQHSTGKGAMFTRINRPARMLAATPCATRADASRLEYAVKRLTVAGKRAAAAGWSLQVGLPGETARKTLLIIFHSVSGAAAQMAAAAEAGARSALAAMRSAAADEDGIASVSTTVQCAAAHEVEAEQLLAADAFLFVCPEMLGSMSGGMKTFFDRCYYPLQDRLNGRSCACLVSAGSDGQGALRQLSRILVGWRLREVLPGRVICVHADTPAAILAPKQLTQDDLAVCHECGATLAAGLEAGLY